VKDKIYEILENLDVEYVRVVNKRFDEIEKIEPSNTIILVVVRFGNVRLLDNIWM
ncbi:MAG: pantoate--beta-alanine ligase, partial [Erysipelotrichia bacterium]|nr:pantoate--beta-alanine ligase [Erysipelotrichia bacterium]